MTIQLLLRLRSEKCQVPRNKSFDIAEQMSRLKNISKHFCTNIFRRCCENIFFNVSFHFYPIWGPVCGSWPLWCDWWWYQFNISLWWCQYHTNRTIPNNMWSSRLTRRCTMWAKRSPMSRQGGVGFVWSVKAVGNSIGGDGCHWDGSGHVGWHGGAHCLVLKGGGGCILFSCRNNSSFRLNGLGPLCLWQCLWPQSSSGTTTTTIMISPIVLFSVRSSWTSESSSKWTIVFSLGWSLTPTILTQTTTTSLLSSYPHKH